MGLDFVKRRAKTFKKAWKNGRVRLAEPDLFTLTPDCPIRTVIADLDPNANVQPGTQIMLLERDTKLILTDGIRQFGTIARPPADQLSAIHESGGIARGSICRINSLSGTADVEIYQANFNR